MSMIVHVCGATWVDPEAISAIKWNSASLEEHPTIILRNGTHLEARGFVREGAETAFDVTERLLMHINKGSKRAWEHAFGVAPVRARYPEADPATSSEG